MDPELTITTVRQCKIANRPNVGLNCLQIEYSKWVVKVTFNAHFQQAENE